MQMSYLDTFCSANFEKRDKFNQVTKKGLLLGKVDFSKKGYKIDRQRFSCNPDKWALSSGKGKK